jgi:predicted small lipoprotein YifL
MRRPILALAALALVGASAGCGGKFPLPTEHPAAKPVPSDKSYAMLATWKGMQGVKDILLTQGVGSQLFVLFSTYPPPDTLPPGVMPPFNGGWGPTNVPRGAVALFPFTRPVPIGPPYFRALTGLFNPVALASARNKLFVLDRGDSCMARFDATRGTCEADPDTTRATGHPHRDMIRDYNAVWRVREYALGGGDTLSSFTDTTFAQVYGVAADDQGYVYVSGIASLLDTLATDQRIRTRKFLSRIFRYARGPRYTGLVPDELNRDLNMPGCNWHRDTTWVTFDGTGASSVSDPRGIVWTGAGLPGLFIADKGNNQAKLISVNQIGVGFVKFDGRETEVNFDSPEGVAMDLQGYMYVVDRNNRRVVRYDRSGNYVQQINIEPNSDGLSLLDPVSVGVDDSLAYVADRMRGQVIRYKRRP